MALEDLTGPDKYIDALVPANPFGTDPKSQGDDHLRGIKNVLKNTFPNVTGVVTATQDDLNKTEVPAGTTMLFVQAAAPPGWEKNLDYDDHLVMLTTGTGGNPLPGGTWIISGFSQTPHTHNAYLDSLAGPNGTTLVRNDQEQVAVASATHLHQGTTIEENNISPAIFQDGTWRPKAAMTIVCHKL